MERIARVARVDCAVMTNIGIAHIEQLGSPGMHSGGKAPYPGGNAARGHIVLKRRRPSSGLSGSLRRAGRRCCTDWAGTVTTGQRTCTWKRVSRVHGGSRRLQGPGAPLKVIGSHMVRAMPWRPWQWRIHTGFPWRRRPLALGQFKGYKGTPADI